MAGGPAFTLTVNGTGFEPDAVVRWNGADRPTVFVSSTSLTAAIPASDIASVGTAAIIVFNPGAGGRTSNSLSFNVLASNPVPSIATLQPGSISAGTGAFTLIVNGTGFTSSSVVQWNGAARQTIVDGDTRLRALILADDVAATGSAIITVFNPGPGGGTSNEVSFLITTPVAVPSLSDPWVAALILLMVAIGVAALRGRLGGMRRLNTP